MLQNIVVYCNFDRLQTPNPPRLGYVSYLVLAICSISHTALEVARLLTGAIYSQGNFCNSQLTWKETS